MLLGHKTAYFLIPVHHADLCDFRLALHKFENRNCFGVAGGGAEPLTDASDISEKVGSCRLCFSRLVLADNQLTDGSGYFLKFLFWFCDKISLTVINTQTNKSGQFLYGFNSLCDQTDILAVAEFNQTFHRRTFDRVVTDIADQGNIYFYIFGSEEKNTVKIRIALTKIIDGNLIILLFIVIDCSLKKIDFSNVRPFTHLEDNVAGGYIITFQVV